MTDPEVAAEQAYLPGLYRKLAGAGLRSVVLGRDAHGQTAEGR